MKKTILSLIAITTLALVSGCSGSREIEVKGDITSTEAVTAPIAIELFDVPEAEDGEQTSVATATLEMLGSFDQKVDVAGKAVRIVAVADADGDGKCRGSCGAKPRRRSRKMTRSSR